MREQSSDEQARLLRRNRNITIVGLSLMLLFHGLQHEWLRMIYVVALFAFFWWAGRSICRWMAATPMQRYLIGAVGVLVVSLVIQAVEHGVDYWNMLIGVAVFAAVIVMGMPWPQDR